jgi:hypothetical protein
MWRLPHFRLIGASKVQGSAGRKSSGGEIRPTAGELPGEEKDNLDSPDHSSSPLRRISCLDFSVFHLKAVFGHEIAALIRIPLHNLFRPPPDTVS